MSPVNEATVESAVLGWLRSAGWECVSRTGHCAGDTERRDVDSYIDVVLEHRLRAALARLNADLAEESVENATRKLMGPAGATLEARNRAFHRRVVDGVTVEYVAADAERSVARRSE